MKPVATYCRSKAALAAAWEVPFGIFWLFLGLLLVPYFVLREHGPWGSFFVSAVGLPLGFASLTNGVRDVRAALEKDCWLSAGPTGVYFRVPGPPRRSSLFFGYDLATTFVPWRNVVTWYTHATRLNGIRVSHRIVFETQEGAVAIPGEYFREPVDEIMAAIRQAAAG